jgi:DNA polymerase
VIQAISRDLLLAGMVEAEAAGGRITMTIHDEIVCEVPLDSPFNLEVLIKCMTTIPAWGEGMGFVLAAEGWEGSYYRK